MTIIQVKRYLRGQRIWYRVIMDTGKPCGHYHNVESGAIRCMKRRQKFLDSPINHPEIFLKGTYKI